jgi:thiol-disulfide isomerase/thioredoxin
VENGDSSPRPSREVVAAGRSLPRGILRGVLIGGVLGLLLAGAAFRGDWFGSALTWRAAALLVAAGALVCSAGEVLAHSPIGACVGLAAGLLVGTGLRGEFGGKARVGEPADVEGPTLSGERFDVADQKGKVVLVDFWATWCPPCREELPRLREMRDRLGEKGLLIVGVSLDGSREELEAFVRKHRLAWPQIFYDQGPRYNPIAGKYKVQAIPYTLLVDRDGTIAASGLRGEELEEAVEHLLEGQPLVARGGLIDIVLGRAGHGLGPLVGFFAVAGWLGGMLLERWLRQPG